MRRLHCALPVALLWVASTLQPTGLSGQNCGCKRRRPMFEGDRRMTTGEWPVLRTALGVVLVTACSTLPKVAGLEHDPSFDYENMALGGIAVAGVASGADTLEAIVLQHALTALLEVRMREERPDVSVLSAVVVVESLGQEGYVELMEEFARSGEIDSATLVSVSQVVPDAQYAVFARVEEDVINEDESTSSNDEEDCEEWVEMFTRREVTISFKVFDLTTGISVWSGWIGNSEKNEEEHCAPDFGGSFWEILAAEVVDEIVYDHPPAPELTEVSGKIFEAFAKELPGR